MTISFNDDALRRSLGTDDPDQLTALKALLNDYDSPISLTNVASYSDEEPVWSICDSEDEIARLLGKYDQPQRTRPPRGRRGPS